MAAPPHLAFVLEQTLGHITHSANLRAALSDDPAARISWLPIEHQSRNRWGRLPLISRNWTVASSLMARRELSRLARQGPIDAYFFHTQVTALGALDLMRERPTILSLDATPLGFDTIGEAYGHRAGGSLAGVKHRLTRTLFRRAAGFVTWSAWAKRSLVDDYGIAAGRVSVIPPGTDLSLWATERPARSADEPMRLLFVGGDFTRKGGADLLEACAPLLGDRCELHVVTREAVAPRPGLVVHHGVAPNSPALRRLFAAADAFALPTHADGLPMAIMEAMAAGLPVISTPVGSIAEAVEPGVTGYLTPPGAVGDLRAAVTTLVEQPDLRRRMGQTARSIAERRYDAHANARRVRDLLLDAVAEARAGRRRSA
jgi:glycosyltransferase involved in cell wall biosynthesis